MGMLRDWEREEIPRGAWEAVGGCGLNALTTCFS